ncbi:DUF397 domain-containing protein [Nocardiopsis sp. NPDC049922]|uniref:DUF397 domain-containing protein n=1 Tax=Nocardiopsis sp. NPDC049922 TaxID=3155157 RepID=UPI0033CD2B61
MISKEWAKSSFSSGGAGNCVEVRMNEEHGPVVEVRDTQNRGLGAIGLSLGAFAELASVAKTSE